MWDEKKSFFLAQVGSHTDCALAPKAGPFTNDVACMLQCSYISGVGCTGQGMAKAVSSIVMGGPVWGCRKKTPLSAHSHSTPHKQGRAADWDVASMQHR